MGRSATIQSLGTLPDVRAALAGKASASLPLGFPNVYFRRSNQETPIADLSTSSESLREPSLYAETNNTTGVTSYWLYATVLTDPTGSVGPGQIGLWTGTSLTALTYQGIVVSQSMFAGQTAVFTSAQLTHGLWIDTFHVLKDPSAPNLYHAWASAFNDTSGLSNGAVYHFTASSPAGPWAMDATPAITQANALPSGNNSGVPADNGSPVLWGGQWLMPFEDYSTSTARYFNWATASSLSGPWTRKTSAPGTTPAIAAPSSGYPLGSDGPLFVADGGKLWLLLTSVNYSLAVYDVTDLTQAYYCCDVMNVSANAIEQGNSAWGHHALFNLNGDLLAVYMAKSSADNYWRVFGAEGVKSALTYVQDYHGSVISGTLSVNGSLSATIPATIPAEATHLDVLLWYKNTGTIGGSEFIGANGGSTFYGLGGAPTAAWQTVKGVLQIIQQVPRKVAVSQVNAVTGAVGVVRVDIAGYYRMP